MKEEKEFQCLILEILWLIMRKLFVEDVYIKNLQDRIMELLPKIRGEK